LGNSDGILDVIKVGVTVLFSMFTIGVLLVNFISCKYVSLCANI
jgi:hypothetical protein